MPAWTCRHRLCRCRHRGQSTVTCGGQSQTRVLHGERHARRGHRLPRGGVRRTSACAATCQRCIAILQSVPVPTRGASALHAHPYCGANDGPGALNDLPPDGRQAVPDPCAPWPPCDRVASWGPRKLERGAPERHPLKSGRASASTVSMETMLVSNRVE